MKIEVVASTGEGPTELSAFDNALVNAGIENFNLLYLSSVIPPESIVENVEKASKIEGKWGDKLYVVMAQARTSKPGEEAWAGVGWIQDSQTNKGLLVEHEGHDESKVKSDIEKSLKALALNRNEEFGPINMRVSGIKCASKAVCAMVVAVFESEGWKS